MHQCIRTSMIVNDHLMVAAAACKEKSPFFARQIEELRMDMNRGNAGLQSLRLLIWQLNPDTRSFYSGNADSNRTVWKWAARVALTSTILGGILGFMGKETAAEWAMYLGAGLPIGGAFLHTLATRHWFRTTVNPELSEAYDCLVMARNEIMGC